MLPNNRNRIVIAALTLSAAGFVGITGHEGFTDKAVIPVAGDVPTIGFGTTQGVKMGDKITPPQALKRALVDVGKFEGAVKQCVTVPLHQYEYDAYVDLAYNIGPTAFCNSTLVARLNEGAYAEACAHVDDFICGPATRKTAAARGERCYSTKKPMKVTPGLVNRRAVERAQCEGRQ